MCGTAPSVLSGCTPTPVADQAERQTGDNVGGQVEGRVEWGGAKAAQDSRPPLGHEVDGDDDERADRDDDPGESGEVCLEESFSSELGYRVVAEDEAHAPDEGGGEQKREDDGDRFSQCTHRGDAAQLNGGQANLRVRQSAARPRGRAGLVSERRAGHELTRECLARDRR